eukprot:jgi/Mesvir1/28498/Mv15910-RA.1
MDTEASGDLTVAAAEASITEVSVVVANWRDSLDMADMLEREHRRKHPLDHPVEREVAHPWEFEQPLKHPWEFEHPLDRGGEEASMSWNGDDARIRWDGDATGQAASIAPAGMAVEDTGGRPEAAASLLAVIEVPGTEIANVADSGGASSWPGASMEGGGSWPALVDCCLPAIQTCSDGKGAGTLPDASLLPFGLSSLDGCSPVSSPLPVFPLPVPPNAAGDASVALTVDPVAWSMEQSHLGSGFLIRDMASRQLVTGDGNAGVAAVASAHPGAAMDAGGTVVVGNSLAAVGPWDAFGDDAGSTSGSGDATKGMGMGAILPQVSSSAAADGHPVDGLSAMSDRADEAKESEAASNSNKAASNCDITPCNIHTVPSNSNHSAASSNSHVVAMARSIGGHESTASSAPPDMSAVERLHLLRAVLWHWSSAAVESARQRRVQEARAHVHLQTRPLRCALAAWRERVATWRGRSMRVWLAVSVSRSRTLRFALATWVAAVEARRVARLALQALAAWVVYSREERSLWLQHAQAHACLALQRAAFHGWARWLACRQLQQQQELLSVTFRAWNALSAASKPARAREHALRTARQVLLSSQVQAQLAAAHAQCACLSVSKWRHSGQMWHVLV